MLGFLCLSVSRFLTDQITLLFQLTIVFEERHVDEYGKTYPSSGRSAHGAILVNAHVLLWFNPVRARLFHLAHGHR